VRPLAPIDGRYRRLYACRLYAMRNSASRCSMLATLWATITSTPAAISSAAALAASLRSPRFSRKPFARGMGSRAGASRQLEPVHIEKVADGVFAALAKPARLPIATPRFSFSHATCWWWTRTPKPSAAASLDCADQEGSD